MVDMKVIERLSKLADMYDKYIDYIDDYTIYEQAKRKNRELEKEWETICNEYNIAGISVYSFANLGDKTKEKIVAYINSKEV